MGLLDLFRSYFPASRYGNERLGPNDLPSDVLDDLRNAQQNEQAQQRSDINGDADTYYHSDPDNRDFLSEDSPNFQMFHNIDREFEDAFQQMDSMFKNFFGAGPSVEFFGGDQPIESENSEERSLRDKMLDKDENSNAVLPFQQDDHSHGFSFRFHSPFFRDMWQSPFHREREFDNQGDGNVGKLGDEDLDNNMSSPSIESILDSQVPRGSNDQSIFGFGGELPSSGVTSAFKYSTVTRKLNPDGSVETTSKKRDSDGNEEVVVSRNMGEQTHTVTSKKNNRGEVEKVEDFINMDENDLKTFDEKWDRKSEESPRDMSELFSSWWKPKL